ncbi:MAG TPA: hypothetical protein PL188_06285 [Candidatus Cloacimonadota bacterium]|nr:hypothetical protein [Candidatus Cloacimonadota bacterium]
MLSTIAQKRASDIFSAPIDYDRVEAEVGDTPEEPSLALKAFKDGQLVFYINYELLSLIGE